MQARLRQCLYSAAGLVLPLLVQITNDMTATHIAARVSCEIRATRDDRGGKLEAVILATGPVAGTFNFTVRKRGGGDPISQAGDFKVEDSSPAEIKKASIALDPGEAYNASLQVKWPNGSSSCSSSVG
jgi:CsgH protein